MSEITHIQNLWGFWKLFFRMKRNCKNGMGWNDFKGDRKYDHNYKSIITIISFCQTCFYYQIFPVWSFEFFNQWAPEFSDVLPLHHTPCFSISIRFGARWMVAENLQNSSVKWDRPSKMWQKRWSSNPLSGSDFETRSSSQLEIHCHCFMKIQLFNFT